MPSSQAVRLRALLRALEHSAGPDQLAAKLKLGGSDLQLMLNGLSLVNEEIFLRAVDLLSGVESIAHGSESARPVGALEFNWLPIDAFKQLTAEQKDRYLLDVAEHFDLVQREVKKPR